MKPLVFLKQLKTYVPWKYSNKKHNRRKFSSNNNLEKFDQSQDIPVHCENFTYSIEEFIFPFQMFSDL